MAGVLGPGEPSSVGAHPNTHEDDGGEPQHLGEHHPAGEVSHGALTVHAAFVLVKPLHPALCRLAEGNRNVTSISGWLSIMGRGGYNMYAKIAGPKTFRLRSPSPSPQDRVKLVVPTHPFFFFFFFFLKSVTFLPPPLPLFFCMAKTLSSRVKPTPTLLVPSLSMAKTFSDPLSVYVKVKLHLSPLPTVL